MMKNNSFFYSIFNRQIYYHVIFFPRFNFKTLGERGQFFIETVLERICQQYRFKMLDVNITEEYIHLHLTASPTVAPVDIVRTLRNTASVNLIKKFPQLKKFYGRFGALWDKDYFITTHPELSDDIIKTIIQELKRR